MTSTEYEFNEEQASHFKRLAKKSYWMAVALSVYAMTNVYIVSQATRKPFTIVLSVLMIALSIRTAWAMGKAGKGFTAITKTQGSDISLMQTSNKNLQLAFTLLSLTFVLLSIRLVYAAPTLIKATL
jgi:hypothetical protein